jgi:L-glyceraldehyde 3-phosphate reductase
MVLQAFDLSITHFDLANNYGPPPGSAEETFGKIIARDLKPYRDELNVSSKAGYTIRHRMHGLLAPGARLAQRSISLWDS